MTPDRPPTPAPTPPDDSAESLLLRLLGRLADASASLSLRVGGLVVEVQVRQATPVDLFGARAAGNLGPCERAVLGVLASAVGRMTGPQIEDTLIERGESWSATTVQRALCRLVRLGMIESSRKAPQGYRLVGKM
jgi:hypothetical protein